MAKLKEDPRVQLQVVYMLLYFGSSYHTVLLGGPKTISAPCESFSLPVLCSPSRRHVAKSGRLQRHTNVPSSTVAFSTHSAFLWVFRLLVAGQGKTASNPHPEVPHNLFHGYAYPSGNAYKPNHWLLRRCLKLAKTWQKLLHFCLFRITQGPALIPITRVVFDPGCATLCRVQRFQVQSRSSPSLYALCNL